MTIWLIIILGGLGTFAIRASFIFLAGRVEMPLWFKRGLRFVPAAVLPALVMPALAYQQGELALSVSNERLVAGLMAALIAWYTKNVLLTISVGMAILWGLQAIG
ncbi:MAG: AzlD domain-containing protein [Okeania sp. SIO3B3]|nr:AzlD domain-containing protein [Okeania sp. SIO3B3]